MRTPLDHLRPSHLRKAFAVGAIAAVGHLLYPMIESAVDKVVSTEKFFSGIKFRFNPPSPKIRHEPPEHIRREFNLISVAQSVSVEPATSSPKASRSTIECLKATSDLAQFKDINVSFRNTGSGQTYMSLQDAVFEREADERLEILFAAPLPTGKRCRSKMQSFSVDILSFDEDGNASAERLTQLADIINMARISGTVYGYLSGIDNVEPYNMDEAVHFYLEIKVDRWGGELHFLRTREEAQLRAAGGMPFYNPEGQKRNIPFEM